MHVASARTLTADVLGPESTGATINRRAIWLARAGFVIALLATVLATVAAMNGRWGFWVVNAMLCAAAAGCTIVNYRVAAKHR